MMILLRLIHIIAGVFWVGTTLFIVFFLEPVVKAAGDEGGKIMQRLIRMRFPLAMSLTSTLTVFAGVWLYWIGSGGFQPRWITSPNGLALTIGSIAGVVAFVLGLLVQARASARLEAIQKEIGAAGGPPSPSLIAEIRTQQESIFKGARWGAVLMVISLVGMAVARYLY